MANDYSPRPLGVDHVQLDADLVELVELLAEHAHDLWALQRMRDGWVHGAERNDACKLHPCLVPYAALPESEKDYDRNAVLGTIRAIVALGFVVLPPDRQRT